MNEHRICDLREDADLLQKDIAKELGVTQQNYSLWETGEKIIPLKHLNSLCNYYNVSMNYVVKLSHNKTFSSDRITTKLDKGLIGNNIKIIRTDNNLSFRTLAKELNTTPSTIHAYETGKTLILTAFAFQICLKYDISLDWLCGRSDIKHLNSKS